jgi:hypothetical protein
MSNPYLAYKARQQPKFGAWFDETVSKLQESIAIAKKGGKAGDKEARHLLQSIEEGTPLRRPEEPTKFYNTTAFKIALVSLLGGGVVLVGLRYRAAR